MDLLNELRFGALTFECMWNQEDFQKLVLDSLRPSRCRCLPD